ncbi:myosin-binding protein 1-like [Canna indica]|uniref:Myosin-binding protein 1-like n=1 Tax=Canna indica TaxID=4628 RepID=A0AAQ3JVI4_9LILI|nr:myosin-binding protein 1-like [Canna indica]
MAAKSNAGGQARFFSVLMSAFCEWSLIVILLINAVLAYAATRIARLCKLPAPCLLCSRLDHILGNERRGFYRNLFCHAHKVDISSLVYCHGHRKLADFREMCEACLLSSAAAAVKKPRTILGVSVQGSADMVDDLDEVPLDDDHELAASSGVRRCSCCSEPCNLRRLLQAKKTKKKKVDGGVANRRVLLRKRPEKTLDMTAPHAYDLISHVGYSELKLTSESESEASFSGEEGDEDAGYSPAAHRVKDIKEESVTRRRQQRGFVMEEMVPERLIHPNPVVPERSHLDLESNKPVKEDDSWDKSSSISKHGVGHGLQEGNWSDADAKKNKSVESSERTIEQVPQEGGVDSSVAKSTNIEVGKMSTSTGASSQVMNEPALAARSSLIDRNDSFKNIALSKKGLMLSPRFSELVAGKAQEDLKLRLSQKSHRVLDLPWSDITSSPKLQAQGEDSTSIGLQNIAKRLTVERSNSCLESFDANLIDDIEGETSIEKLKQQIALDRKSLSALYKELEEERNASAVAANEAMAMINRLQEEKAGIQMEALQYLRMMEEQAEYDQEAIHKLNDLLTDREKELLDLEAELDSCRRRLGDEMDDDSAEPMSDASESRGLGLFSASNTPRNMKLLGRSRSEKTSMIHQEDLLLSFEEEKAQISASLKRLENKLHGESIVVDTNGVENGEEEDSAEVENGLSEKKTEEQAKDKKSSLQEQVSKLNQRLNALDADRDFLGHTINALKHGSDGVRLVQEIASYLKELRRIPMTDK